MPSTAQLTLTDFLLARIAEDETLAREAQEPDWTGEAPSFYESLGSHRDGWGLHTFNVPPARVVAECEAKRRILGLAEVAEEEASEYLYRVALLALAVPYANHPDYRDEWRP